VLKGGVALEVRLKERARATRNLDLAIREDVVAGEEVRDLLIDALAVDVDGDGFSFQVGSESLARLHGCKARSVRGFDSGKLKLPVQV